MLLNASYNYEPHSPDSKLTDSEIERLGLDPLQMQKLYVYFHLQTVYKYNLLGTGFEIKVTRTRS
jgi:hypothetical protein